MNRSVPLLLPAGLVAISLLVEEAKAASSTFVAGQNWVCVTDQQANAYLKILGIDGDTIVFNWGVFNADTQTLEPLCNKRAKLSLQETTEFCREIGTEFSQGHALLQMQCGGVQ